MGRACALEGKSSQNRTEPTSERHKLSTRNHALLEKDELIKLSRIFIIQGI